MSSEKTASAVNILKGDLAAGWNLLEGSSADYTDLGIARRFGGSSAAYSLRDIGAMNGRVVKARRDVGETSDPEEDFSANQVQSGILEDWVNGKLESTLPADVATAAAAYSLRKAKASYSGDAVRIRRSSDDVEVDVAFDSNDKVSASSAITNIAEQGGEIGSTSATDLNGFLTEQSFFYKQEDNTSSSSYNLSRNSTRWNFSKVSSVSDGTTTKTGEILKLEATGTNGTFILFFNPEVGCTGQETTITFDYLFPSSNSDTDIYVNVNDSASTSAGSPTVTPNDINGAVSGTWTTASHTFSSASSGQLSVRLTNSPTSTIGASVTPDAGDEFYITNLKVSTVKAEAFVHTWYDQAGSNDATQATDANQPKIAEGGALLADGVTFDGTDDFLQTSGQVLTNNYTGARSLYGVCKINTDSGYIFGDTGSGTNEGTSFYSDTASDKIFFTNGKSGTLVDYDNITTIEGSNFLISSNYNNNNTTTIHKNSNNNGYTQGTDTYNFTTSSQFTIGDRQGGSSAATRFNGSVQEIIAYDSDQSANRFKIESNINNYYGLYNDANETNGDFDKTFSPTADGTFTPNGKDGFTLAVVSSTVYAGIKLNADVTSGDSIYVSFNCSFDAGSPSPKIVLRDTDSDFFGGGTLMSNEESVVNGFNSFTLTSTNSSASGVVLSEADNNLTYSISDFKVSRIARNGFVETLYDQSGNGNNASQASAGAQPTIVSNGNQVTLDNGTPSVAFKRPSGEGSDTMSISSAIANEPYTFFATTVNNASNAFFRLFGESNAAPTVLLRSNNTIDYNPSDSDASGSISATTTSDNIVSGFSGVNGGADGILRFNGTNLKTDISRTQDGDSISLVGRFPNVGTGFAYIESLVFYESDLTADFDTIEKELAQPINIL